MFVEPAKEQLDAARALGAPVVELHTGAYANATGAARAAELARIRDAANHGVRLGLQVHAGHGLTFDNVGPIAAIQQIVELNIGHFLIGEAIFVGLDASIREMRRLMDIGRGEAIGA
jgi:pyridoxine 5-phosphate synthase